ncbi:MAG: translation initiation factor IF-2 [Rubripirellula sp.]
MPARIYALAKELNLDSKDLVTIVKKVGITGKGSALASLTDEETQKVRDHLAGASKPAAAAPIAAKSSAPIGAVRDAVPKERKPVAIPRVKKDSKQVEPEVVVEPVVQESVETPAPAEEAPVAETPAPAAAPTPPPQTPAAEEPAKPSGVGGMASRIKSRMGSRKMAGPSSDTAAPIRSEAANAGGKVRSLDRPSTGPGGDKKGNDKSKRREPVIKMASLPEVAEPAPSKPRAGEKAQKPDVKLSREVIQGHRQGMSAPLQQAKQDAETKRAATPSKKTGGLSGFTGDKRRGKDGEEEDKPKRKLAGMANARVERGRGRGRGQITMDHGGGYGSRRRTGGGRKRKGVNTAAPRKEAVSLELPCTIRSFSESAGVPVGKVLGTMMGMGMQAGLSINAEMDLETAELVASELDLSIQLKASETLEDSLISELEEREDDADSLVPRAPIVTFLGHVDHGKTSLLDYLIGIDVVSGEAGGITQHIRAYEVDKDGRSVTFVDTPGHEAFTEMRARGANVTDIAVLVIAADDGIMPQTEEAISHAKAAEVPIVVALNKCDLEGVDTNRVMTQLTEHQLTPSEWGGDVEVVHTSAIKGTGMDTLLDTLLTISELNEYTANPSREALGVCLESEQQGDRGVVAKLVVQNGTMRVGDILVCGSAHGRVRAMTDTLTGEAIEEAGPSTPVNVTGFDQPPGAGDRFHVLSDIGKAREIAASRAHASSQETLSGVTTKVSFEKFQNMLEEGRLGQQEEKVKLNLIIRADVKGSLEAIDKEISKLDNPEVEVRVLQRSVGGVTLADVTLASASDAVVAAFNVIPDEQARSLADERNVEIRRYDVIYKLTDDIRAMIEGRLKPEERMVELGRALVKQVFSISRVGTIAGCYVAQGSIQRGCRIRVNRDGRTIGDYGLDSLKRIKEDVKEVPRGMECGIRLQGFNDIKQDDVLEAYRIEEFARTLD